MEKKLDEIKKELRNLYIDVDITIDLVADGEISKSYIMDNLHDIHVRVERLINQINAIEVLSND